MTSTLGKLLKDAEEAHGVLDAARSRVKDLEEKLETNQVNIGRLKTVLGMEDDIPSRISQLEDENRQIQEELEEAYEALEDARSRVAYFHKELEPEKMHVPSSAEIMEMQMKGMMDDFGALAVGIPDNPDNPDTFRFPSFTPSPFPSFTPSPVFEFVSEPEDFVREYSNLKKYYDSPSNSKKYDDSPDRDKYVYEGWSDVVNFQVKESDDDDDKEEAEKDGSLKEEGDDDSDDDEDDKGRLRKMAA